MAVGIGKYLRSKTRGRRYRGSRRGMGGPIHTPSTAENTRSTLPTWSMRYGRGCGYAVDAVF